MTAALTGGCACGRVRYECNERPLAELICHCRDCQYASGSAYAAALVVPTDRLTLSGAEPRYYEVKASSGRTMRRGFCEECGSPVLIRRPETPLVVFLQASSLDDPSTFSPSSEVWTSRAYPWHHLHPDTERFEEGPSHEAVRAPIEAYFASRKGAA